MEGLSGFMASLSDELKLKHAKRKAPEFKAYSHSCKLFFPCKGKNGWATKAFTCVECGHATHTHDNVAIVSVEYPFGDCSLDTYFERLELELKNTKPKNQVQCKICKFQSDPKHMVNFG